MPKQTKRPDPVRVDTRLFAKDVLATMHGRSVRECAAEADISPSTFQRVGDNVLDPSLHTYARLCRWMKCSLDYYVRP